MAFENMTTWLISFGYIFVIVIAGSALFVGAVKKKNRDKKRLEESKKEQTQTTESNQTDKPETETTEPVVEEKPEEKETDKTE